MKCFLIGTNTNLLKSVATYLQVNFFYITIVETVNTYKEVTKIIDLTLPNLVIFDVEVDTQIPFNILRKARIYPIDFLALAPKNNKITDILENHKINYISKPIDDSELRININSIYANRSKEEELQKILTRIRNTAPKKRIAIPQEKQISMIPTEEVLYIEADINYCQIHILDKKTICISKTLKSFEQQLVHNREFFRIHQSYLINLNCIHRIIKTKLPQVEMINGDILTISRSKKTSFLKLILE